MRGDVDYGIGELGGFEQVKERLMGIGDLQICLCLA